MRVAGSYAKADNISFPVDLDLFMRFTLRNGYRRHYRLVALDPATVPGSFMLAWDISPTAIALSPHGLWVRVRWSIGEGVGLSGFKWTLPKQHRSYQRNQHGDNAQCNFECKCDDGQLDADGTELDQCGCGG